jgi:hypothetical protein
LQTGKRRPSGIGTEQRYQLGGFLSQRYMKNISQLGLLFPIYGKIKNIPNHQPDNLCIIADRFTVCLQCNHASIQSRVKKAKPANVVPECSMYDIFTIFLPTFDHLGDFGGTLW